MPVIVYWLCKNRAISPKTGLLIGSVAGAGFGILEAQWIPNPVFISGMSWYRICSEGLLAPFPFWERFFAIAFLTGASALAGYGLGIGRGKWFYLIAAFLHGLLNCSVVLFNSGIITLVQGKVFLSLVAVILTAYVLKLRWKKTEIFRI